MHYTVTIDDFEIVVDAQNPASAKAQAEWAMDSPLRFEDMGEYGIVEARYVGAWA